MRQTLSVAAVQMTSAPDIAANLDAAGYLVAEAASQGAQLVVLPENFALFGAGDAQRLNAAESIGYGPVQQFLSQQAARHGVWLVGGTLPVVAADGRAHASALVFDSRGQLAGRYDKIHLFDVDVPAEDIERYRESDATAPGTTPGCFDTDLGRLAVAVCYDIRFPALFHRLGQQQPAIIAVPAAFTVPTGRAHWSILLRARAVESLAFVVAAAQSGQHANGRRTFGHSMIIGPWGDILAECPEGPGVVTADLDLTRLRELRAHFPALDHRREL
jgi:predicted amidohydrolase